MQSKIREEYLYINKIINKKDLCEMIKPLYQMKLSVPKKSD